MFWVAFFISALAKANIKDQENSRFSFVFILGLV